MIFTRVRSYYEDGRFTTCEQLYVGSDQNKALERFRRDYPAHKDCILVAEWYDSEDVRNTEHFAACQRCGCVNYW